MAKIAISYRRSDSQDITGRIFDRLAQHFGKETVFRDIDSMEPGVDFRDQISKALTTSDVLLAIVGPKWLGLGEGTRHRIQNEDDPVRVEVETALTRKIPIVPVLVGGMTTANSLTPAACAGQTVIISVDGYAAAPPGIITPTRRIGR